MSTRYGLGSLGALTYGIESTAYSQETGPNTEFGITNEDIEPSNENPQTAMATGGGGRQPYVQSPDPKEYNFDVPTVIHDPNAPIEIALGSRQETTGVDPDGAAGSGDEYDEYLFTEADRLPTATIRHVQQDLDMVAYYVGCKANLTAEWSLGDPLQFSFDIQAAKHSFDPSESAPSISPTLPTDISPYRAHMQGNLTLDDQGGALVTEVATVNGGSWGIDNGLEAQHHGGDGTGADRDAYSVAETTAADKHDISLDLNVTDTDLYEEAANNDRLLDAEIPCTRQVHSGTDTIIDGVIFRANACKLINAPLPRPVEGVIEGEVGLAPQGGVEIEVRSPA